MLAAQISAVLLRQFQQRCDVLQRHVQPLSANGGHHMGGFCNQGDAFRRETRGMLADDWPDRPFGGQRQRAEHMGTAVGRGLGKRICVKRHPRKAGRAVIHPHHGRAGQTVAIGQGYKGEGAPAAVHLGRHVFMRDRVCHGKGKRLLAIALAGHLNTGSVAHGAVAPVCGNHELGRNFRAIAEAYACAGGAGEQACGCGAGAEIDVRQSL